MAGSSIIKNKFDEYKSCANDAIHFKLVRDAKDLDKDELVFKPEMTHQIFGEAESIFGYKDLVVQVYYTAAQLNAYINLEYSSKVPEKNEDGFIPDEVLPSIVKHMGSGVYTNLEDFIRSLESESSFKPFGSLINMYKVISPDNQERNYEVYRTKIDEPGFRDYHTRLQPFILYFIDAASFIDVDDEKWLFYLLFEKYKNSTGETLYSIVGYMTIYNYYAYPEMIRPRISQMLVFPPYQCQGHGSKLLQTLYNDMFTRSDVLDITVEDPSDDFQRMRDFVDAKNCKALKSYSKDCLLNGFCDEMHKEAREKLKLSKRQSRRVYEILRLSVTDIHNDKDFTEYRLDIKRRLNAPFQKTNRDLEKLQKVNGTQVENAPGSLTLTKEQRQEYLEKTFQEDIDMYRHVLDKLAKYG